MCLDELDYNMEINNKASIVLYESQELKLKLQQYKISLRKLNTKKSKYLKKIDDFNTRYTQEFHIILDEILRLRIKQFKKEFISFKSYYDDLMKLFKEKKDSLNQLKKYQNELLEQLCMANDFVIQNIKEELLVNKNNIKQTQLTLQNIKLSIQQLNIKDKKYNYEEAFSDYKEFSKSYSDLKTTKFDLNSQEEKELKYIYKKASKLCHPDMVDEFKLEDAQEVFKELNEAYKNKNLNKLQEIFSFLEGANIFKKDEVEVEDIDSIKKDIKNIKFLLKNILQEINEIKNDEKNSFIFEIDNMDEYFSSLKQSLQEQLNTLKEVSKSSNNNAQDEWIKQLFKWADKYKITQNILPRNIEKLKRLKKLNLSKLELRSVSSELSYLSNLEELNLSYNNLSNIPEEIAKLKSLKLLDLSYNNLEELPSSFKEFKVLQTLNLSFNSFSHFPKSILNLDLLLNLNLSNNKITNFTNELNNLSSLKELILSKNNLSSIPSDIALFKRLELLDFGGNYIDSIPDEIENLKNLKKLSLWGNNLSKLNDAICVLNNLEYLNIGSNNLTSLPKDIINLTNIKELEIFMNNSLVLNKSQEQWEDKINPSLF